MKRTNYCAPRPSGLPETRPLHLRYATATRLTKPGTWMSDEPYRSWQCRTCGYIYNEQAGAPDEGLAPGTRWAEIPDDWVCPDCGTAKSDFDMVEV